MRRAGMCPPAPRLARLAVLELADVVDDSLAEAVDVHPRAVAHTVACRSYVDHVALAARSANTVVRLLIRNNDDAVVTLVNSVECGAEVGSAVRLTRLHCIAQSESAPGRDTLCGVREGVNANLLSDLSQEHRETICRVGPKHLR